MSKIIVVTIEPVQQVAAEPGTLDQLTASLRAGLSERLEQPVSTGQIGHLSGWPLVADPYLPAGFVYLRPHPSPADSGDDHTVSIATLETELRTAAARLRDGSTLKGRVDSDSRELLAIIRILLQLPEPLAQWLDEQAQYVAASGMYDVLAVDVARAVNGTSEPGRGEDGHIEDRHSGASLYEQLRRRAAGETR